MTISIYVAETTGPPSAHRDTMPSRGWFPFAARARGGTLVFAHGSLNWRRGTVMDRWWRELALVECARPRCTSGRPDQGRRAQGTQGYQFTIDTASEEGVVCQKWHTGRTPRLGRSPSVPPPSPHRIPSVPPPYPKSDLKCAILARLGVSGTLGSGWEVRGNCAVPEESI